jgi:hypothetical protein
MQVKGELHNMRNQRHTSRGRHEVPRRTRRQPRRPLVAALGLLVAFATVVGGGMAFAAQTDQGAQPEAAAAEPNPNCTLIVPPDPLSAAGLATPYRLTATNPKQGPCREANAQQAAFVQSSVLDPATGQVSVYNPLVVDDGQRPAVPPVTPQLPAGAVVGVWFGFNGTNLTLRDDRGSLAAGKCVNGLGKSVFGQFAHCNAPAFFDAANAAIGAGKLVVPPLGTAQDGQDCPTTRDFSAVDQDQSDNLTTTYLIVGRSAAQNTTANRAQLGGRGKVQVNGSDNLLVDEFIDKALGCTPFKAPDLADNGAMVTSLALNELHAAAGQKAPVALVPPNNPMAKVGNAVSLEKLNLYRAGVDQPPLDKLGDLGTAYCQDMLDIQQKRLQADRHLFSQVMSPDKAAADNLFSFLANRLMNSFTNLGCGDLLQMKNPVTVQMKGDVVVDATFFGTGVQPSATANNNNHNNQRPTPTPRASATGNADRNGNNGHQAGTSPSPTATTPGSPTAPSPRTSASGTSGAGASASQRSAPAPTATGGAGTATGGSGTATKAPTTTGPTAAPTAPNATTPPNVQPDPNKAGDGSAIPRSGKF